MRRIFRALAKALRRLMARLRAGAAWGAGVLDATWMAIVGGGYVDEIDDENDDVATTVEDRRSEQETREAIQRPARPDWSPAGLVKRAVELRSASRPIEGIFDMDDPEQRCLHAYVEALDEGGLRAIRHMPEHTLAKHLDGSIVAVGLRPVGQTIRLAQESAKARSKATREKNSPKTRSGRRRTAEGVVSTARAAGRRITLADVVAANRAGR